MLIRTISTGDATQVAAIYNYYIANTVVTFDEQPVTAQEMSTRIAQVTEKYPWIAGEENGRIIGYAYASAWKVRSAYRHSAEVSIYLEHGYSRKGYGSLLYTRLLEQLQLTDLHAIIGGIAMPNEGCVHLHEKFGFEKIAHFKEVGFKLNRWVDVAYYEKILKRE